MRKRLTTKTIEAMKPGHRRMEYWDSMLPGFGVRVNKTGRISFFVMVRDGKRQRRLTLGKYPVMNLGEAREAGRQAIAEAEAGKLPSHDARRDPLSVAEALERFIELHAKRKNRDWRGAQRRLERSIGDAYGDRDIRTISRQDINAVLDRIVDRGAEIQANRVLASVRKFFAWSVERAYLDVNPAAGISSPSRERPRDRVLSDEELRKVWNASDKLGFPFGPIVQLLILTGQRRGEIAGMRRSEFDLDARLWTIPAERAKNGRAHTVPLSDAAIDILDSLPRFLGSDFVFTTTGTSPFSGFGKLKARLDQLSGVYNWRLHDLRRSTATGLARNGVAPHIIERILNHSSGAISGVAATYNRFSYEPETREALEAWDQTIQTITEVPMISGRTESPSHAATV